LIAALLGLSIAWSPAKSPTHHVAARKPLETGNFAAVGDHFELNGKPFVIRSGEMHYPRVPREYWRDRFRKAKAMGLNTICTYVFWNLHEATPGHFDFTGNLDLLTYLKIAKEEGLYIILRPGPYICTELDFGGLPAWLLKDPTMKVRSRDPKFLKATGKYLDTVGALVKPMLIQNGGNVIMTQVENEYGSYGSDHVYMGAIRDALLHAGFSGQLSTSDGPGDASLKAGTLPGIAPSVNFGGGGPGAIAELEKFRPGTPKIVGEYWCGWFDHWGERHHRTSAAGHLKDIEWFLKNDVSFNLYMFHGGTSFAFMPGANGGADSYQPDITSYDYDSPLDESGRITPKYKAFRDAILKVTGETPPPIPPSAMPIALPTFPLTKQPLTGTASQHTVKKSMHPLAFEALGQAYGMVLYSTEVMRAGVQPLEFEKVHDYAIVFVNGKKVGTIDRREPLAPLSIEIPSGGATLQILAEANARINFGGELPNEREGILGKVKLGGKELTGWSHALYPLSKSPGAWQFDSSIECPNLYTGAFNVAVRGDTFLDMGGFMKGYVWVNGHNLGRYWNAGPQRTLYLPGCWVRKGFNQITVLDLGDLQATPTLTGLKYPILDNRPPNALKPLRKEGQALKLAGITPDGTGSFEKTNGWKEFKLPTVAAGRFVCFEVLSEHGEGPYASGSELEVLDRNGHPLTGVKVIYADSEELDSENGSAANLVDHKPATIWHTEWSGGQPGLPHQVVLDLGQVRFVSGIRYLPRPSGPNGRVKDFRVFVSSRLFPGL